MNRSALIALAEGMLAPARQERLTELLDRNKEDALTAPEQHELDELLEYLDQMNLIRATIAALHRNRPSLVQLRGLWRKPGVAL